MIPNDHQLLEGLTPLYPRWIMANVERLSRRRRVVTLLERGGLEVRVHVEWCGYFGWILLDSYPI